MPSSSARDLGRSVRAVGEMPRLNVVAVFLLLACVAVGGGLTYLWWSPVPVIAGVVLGVILMQSPQVANQWDRAMRALRNVLG